MEPQRPRLLLLLSAGAMLATAVGLGFGLGRGMNFASSVVSATNCQEELSFLNPWLRCAPADELQKKEYTEFKELLETSIRDAESEGVLRTVAVYFRDLENGPWFGIDEDALFSPASMLKLPLLIAYYKRAESEPAILGQEIEIAESSPVADEGDEPGSLMIGGKYTLAELLRRMIVYSDNTPLHLLMSYLSHAYPDDDIFAETLAAMGIAKSEGSVDDFLTVKRYSSIYRALYNASFLSKEQSQQALDLLTRSASPKGIREGVPSGVAVAHKFGIRESEGQLHDCGIVYHPKNHYLLCIMTKGSDTADQSEVIAEISRRVYEEVDKRSRR